MGKGNFLPIVVAALIVFALAGFIIFKPSFQKLGTPTTTPPPTSTSSNNSLDPCDELSKGTADIPPLYQKGGVSWQRTLTTAYEVPIGEQGVLTKNGCLIKSQSMSDTQGRDIRVFYSGKLMDLRWSPLVSADGMYSSIESYRKGDKYFVIQQKSAPKEFPKSTETKVEIEVFLSK